jgi:E3 ubiquitin-protein ligase makorin
MGKNSRKRPMGISCRFYEAGNCRKGSRCRFLHEEVEEIEDQQVAKISRREEEPSRQEEKKEEVIVEICSICLESNISTYGLLIGCDHIFCIACISSWRNEANSTSMTRSELEAKRGCPTCRQHSNFVISSAKYVTGNAKDQLIAERLEERQRTQCRYWMNDRRCK